MICQWLEHKYLHEGMRLKIKSHRKRNDGEKNRTKHYSYGLVPFQS